MKKLDPMQSAEKIRKDLNSELDAGLEKAMGSEEASGKQKEVSSGQDKETTKMKLSDEQMEALLKEGVEIEKKKKMEEVDEAGDLKLADKMKSEKEAPKEELGEASDLELSDKIKKEAKKESSGEKLEALSKELEKARGEYIKKDYEIDKKANIIYRALRIEGLGKLGLGNARDEVEEYKNNYGKALKDYKDAVIDSEVGDKEDIEIAARGLVIGENLNRESVRADLEAEEEGWSKTLIKGFNGLMEGYKKQSFKKKLLIGASIAGTGFALSTAGGAAAMGGGIVVAGYRAFTMGVSSVGFSQMLEARAQRGKGKKAEKEVEKIKDSRFEGSESDIELSYEKLKEALDKNIENVNSKVQKEKQWKVWRKYIGAGMGVSMSIAGRYLGKEIAEYFSGGAVGESGVHSEAIKAGAAGALHDSKFDTLSPGVNREAIENQVRQALRHNLNFDAPGETAAGVEAAEAVSGVEIAKSGDSVWKLAENQLESRGYFKGLTGTPEEILAKKTYLIDAIKDKIAENPKDFGLTDADKIQIRQKIDFSNIFENKNDIGNIIDKAESLGKGDIESITQNLAGESSPRGVETGTAEVKTEMPAAEAPATEAPVEMSEMLGLNPAEYNAVSKLNVEEFLEKYGDNKDYAELSKFVNSQMDNVPEAGRRSVDEFLARVNPEDSIKYLAGVLQQETAETIRTCAGNNIEDWNNIKNVLVVNSGKNEIVENLRAAVSKVLPEGTAEPSNSDTVESWATKITKEAYKRGTLDELREQLAVSRK